MSTLFPIPQTPSLDMPPPPHNVEEQEPSFFHGFWDHVGELRGRILVSVITWLLCTALAFWLSPTILNFLKHLAPPTAEFVQLSPGEVLTSSFHIAFLLGLVLASPVLLYELLRFVLPGLTGREKPLVLSVVVGGVLLFLVGLAFADWAVIPPALTFLLDYGQEVARNQMSIAQYTRFCVSLFVLTGLLFECPMVLTLLVLTGLMQTRTLLAHWRNLVIGIVVVAAVITPTQDPITLIIVSAAMLLLCFGSLLPLRMMGK